MLLYAKSYFFLFSFSLCPYLKMIAVNCPLGSFMSVRNGFEIGLSWIWNGSVMALKLVLQLLLLAISHYAVAVNRSKLWRTNFKAMTDFDIKAPDTPFSATRGFLSDIKKRKRVEWKTATALIQGDTSKSMLVTLLLVKFLPGKCYLFHSLQTSSAQRRLVPSRCRKIRRSRCWYWP